MSIVNFHFFSSFINFTYFLLFSINEKNNIIVISLLIVWSPAINTMLPNLRKLLHVDHIHLIFQTLFLQVSFRNSNILHRSFNFFGKKHSLIGDRLVGCVKQCEYTVTKGNLCKNVWNIKCMWGITMFFLFLKSLILVAKN